MVKNKLAVADVFTIAFSLSTIYVNAQVKILKQYTNYTYAKYDHIDNSLDDEYRSDVSIRGADRITTGTTRVYPHKLWITYDVQGEITVVSIFSDGRNDTVQRRNRQVVKDKWNLSFLSTTAKWNSTLLPVEGVIITPTSTEDPQDNGN